MAKMKRRNDFFLTSKFVLLFVFLVAVGSIIGYAMTRNVSAIVLFCLIGFITSFFSKNMIVVLLIPIVGTAMILTLCRTTKVEGLEDGQEEEEEEKVEGFEDGQEEEEEEKVEGYEEEERGEEEPKPTKKKRETELTPEQQVVNIYKESMEKLTEMSNPEQQGEQMKEILKQLLQ